MELIFIKSNTLKDDMVDLWPISSKDLRWHWINLGGCRHKLELVGVIQGQSYQVELLQSGEYRIW